MVNGVTTVRKELQIYELTEDHRIPLSRGGTDWIANIVPCCLSCNCSKGNKTELGLKNGVKTQS